MEESNKNPPKIGASQIKKIVSKVIVITPKQIAEMGLQNQLKNVKMGTVIGRIADANSGDGKPMKSVKTELLNNLRTKMTTLLNHSQFVMQVDPKDSVDLVYDSDESDEACDEAAEVIQIVNDINDKNETEGRDNRKINVLSNEVVNYSSDDVDVMLTDPAQQKDNDDRNLKTIKTVLLNNNKTLQKKLVTKSSDSENLLYVPDLPEAAASQITTISSDSESDHTSEKETKVVPEKKERIDLDTLIAAKQVIKEAAARSGSVPQPFRLVKTYSKVQTISVVRGPISKDADNTRVIRIHKRGKKGDDDADWISPERPKPRKPRTLSSADEELQTSVEDKVRRIMDECKEKETVEQVVAPKKRGRPRKTPLQPKVDVDPTDTDKVKNNTSDKPEIVTPRKRGRPRKVSVEPKDDKNSEDISPKKKQRRRKSDDDEREFNAPSSTPGGLRTSLRKRKVVDYAALSGGRISSSEEEDFAEIERLTGIRHASSEEETDEEEEEEEEEGEEEVPKEGEDKEKASTKTEAVHPLKKRLKMEHQAAEKEKADEIEEKKDKDENKKSEQNDVQNNSVKEKPEEVISIKEVKKENDTAENDKVENENSIHKNDNVANDKNTEKSESNKQDTNESEQVTEPDNNVDAKDNQDDKNEEEASTETTAEASNNESDAITCAVCKETVDSESSWVKHKQGRHNNLAWKVGEPPLEVPQRETEQM